MLWAKALWFYRNMKHLFVLSSICLVLFSCGPTHRIPEAAYAYLPYAGNEILVFESNLGEADTMFLTGTDRRINPTDPLDFFPTRVEHFTVGVQFTDPSPPGGMQRYLRGTFVELSMSADDAPWLDIDFKAKDAVFYGASRLALHDFDQLPVISLPLGDSLLHDIVVFEDHRKEYYERSNHVERLYWSKREGLVRYDKKGQETWVLKRKFVSKGWK